MTATAFNTTIKESDNKYLSSLVKKADSEKINIDTIKYQKLRENFTA